MVFGLLFFALLYVEPADRAAPRAAPTRFLTPEQEAVERVRQAFEPYLRWLMPARVRGRSRCSSASASRASGRPSCCGGTRAGVEFGDPEPMFDRDPAFYIFSLPWLQFLQGWLFSSLVGVTLLTGDRALPLGRHPAAGAARGRDKVTPAARAHLSVLLGLIMLAKAWGYYLGRFDLLTSTRGVVEGASYTDVNAQLPALNFLMIAAVICAVLFLVNIRVRLWSLPVIAVGAAGAGLGPARHGLPGVRAAVPRRAAGVPARAALHRATTSRARDERSRSDDDRPVRPSDRT